MNTTVITLFERYIALSDAYWKARSTQSLIDEFELESILPPTSSQSLAPVQQVQLQVTSKLVADAIAETDMRTLYAHLVTAIDTVNTNRGLNTTLIALPTQQQFQQTILPALIRQDMGVRELRRLIDILVNARYESRMRRPGMQMLPVNRGTSWQYLIKLVQSGKSINVIDELFAMRQRFVQVNPGKLLEVLEDYCEGDIDLFYDFWGYFDELSVRCFDSQERGRKLFAVLKEVDRLGSVRSWIAALEGSTVPKRQPAQMTQMERYWYEQYRNTAYRKRDPYET